MFLSARHGRLQVDCQRLALLACLLAMWFAFGVSYRVLPEQKLAE